MNKNEVANIASNIYAEVDAVLRNHNADDVLRDEITAVFEDYGADTARLSLNSLTWAEIGAIAARGDAPRAFKVGDYKTVELITGEKIEVVILGFNHDVLSGTDADKTAPITFGMRGVLDGWYEMNDSNTNRGGWRDSKMRTVYMERFYTLLPADLQALIKPVVKLTGTGGGGNDIASTDDKLFLLSDVEVTGDEGNYADGAAEGEQYDYFKRLAAADTDDEDDEDEPTYDREKAIKLRSNGGSYGWWLRSPNVSTATNFRYVSYDGGITVSGANYTSGVSFGFCI